MKASQHHTVKNVFGSLIFLFFTSIPGLALQPIQPIEFCILGAPGKVPTNVQATDGTYISKVVVTYSTSSCNSSYKIYRALAGAVSPINYIGTSTTGTFEDTTATLGTHYYYYVKGVNANGESAFSTSDEGYSSTLIIVPMCPIMSPPAIPTGISATDGSYSNKVVISSYDVSCASSYLIYRSNTPGGAKTYIGTTSDSSYSDTTVIPNQIYYYYVKAKNSYGSSGYSSYNQGSAHQAVVAPTAPNNFQATQGTYNDKIKITWDAVSGVDGYLLYRNTTGSGYYDQIGWPSISGTSYDDSTVTPGTTYYYIIKSYKGSTESDVGGPISGYANSSGLTQIPDIPSAIVATDGTYSDKVQVTVSTVTGATRYEVYRSENSSNVGSKIGSSSSAIISDTSVTPGVTYYYRVKACNNDGCSDYTLPDSGYANDSSSQSLEDKVKTALLAKGEYNIGGTFGKHDFSGVDQAFDWAFTIDGGSSYQLQGNAATANDVFGWKEVAIPMPTPLWYMFSLGADIDEDGSMKFDWVLVSTDTNNKAVYKLKGETPTGNFDYSSKIFVDYSISPDGAKVTFSN